jgi:serine-type D-Ala-D-Ala carboxypeptidase (penicillin-binding protein 5/6)
VSEDTSPPLMVAPFRLDTLYEPPPPSPEPSRGRHAVHSHRRRHRWRRRLLLVGLVVVLAAAGIFSGLRLSRQDPVPAVTAVLPHTVVVPSRAVSLPWPSVGQAAVSIPAIGIDVASGPETPVPVASLTKLMTAYVVLRDHPLAAGQPGPTLTVTATDVTDYQFDTVDDDSNAMVALGEQLTEREVLAGMLVHSADNYADLLARWDAGSIQAFVDKMNAAAAQLGMSQSHFADASGIDAKSQSTASDILKVAAPDMADRTFASMVKQNTVTLPLAGTLGTYTPLVGLAGVIGVKSGFTVAAGGCDVLGVVRMVHGRPVLLLAAVTGQQGSLVLAQAGLHGLALVSAVAPLIAPTPVVSAGQVVAHVSEAGQTVDARAAADAWVLAWPGVRATLGLQSAKNLRDTARRGEEAGTVVVRLGEQRVSVPARLARDVPRPSVFQKLFGQA